MKGITDAGAGLWWREWFLSSLTAAVYVGIMSLGGRQCGRYQFPYLGNLATAGVHHPHLDLYVQGLCPQCQGNVK